MEHHGHVVKVYFLRVKIQKLFVLRLDVDQRIASPIVSRLLALQRNRVCTIEKVELAHLWILQRLDEFSLIRDDDAIVAAQGALRLQNAAIRQRLLKTCGFMLWQARDIHIEKTAEQYANFIVVHFCRLFL